MCAVPTSLGANVTQPTPVRAGLAAVGAVVAIGLSGCGLRPDPNPAVRVTGDRDAAIPPTSTTEAPSTTLAPTTTLFYENGAPD